MTIEQSLNKLLAVYKQYNKIIVGVDFDDTLFKYSEDKLEKDCEYLRSILVELRPHITLCLYTIADDQSMKYKLALMKIWGLTPDYVNESPVNMPTVKPYFNLLLDDKAGLNEATELLTRFKQNI